MSRWSDYWDDRPERVARRRAAFWDLYGQYTAVREKMTQDQKTMAAVSLAVSVLASPVGGIIAEAAMQVDKHIAPQLSDLAGSEEAIALMMIEELERDGTLSAREARNLAQDTIRALDEIKNETSPAPVRPRFRPPPGPRPGMLPPATAPAPPATAKAEPVNYWPFIAIGAAILFLRGS